MYIIQTKHFTHCVTLVYYICVAMSLSQSPREILMVRPCNFMFNQETAVTNHYQVYWKVITSFQKILSTLRMKIQTVQTISGDRRPWRSLTRPWRPWGRTPSRWPCSRWGHSLSLQICLLISLVRTCLTTWGLMQCSLTIGSQSITLERSSSTPWPRQTGERRLLIG